MINLPKTSTKIFVECLISLVCLLLVEYCATNCKELGCLGCIYFAFPLFIWLPLLFIFTIVDLIKDKDDKILELIVLGFNILILFSGGLTNFIKIGRTTISGVGYLALITILLLTIKNKISGNEIETNETKSSGSYIFAIIFSIIGIVIVDFLYNYLAYFIHYSTTGGDAIFSELVFLTIGAIIGWKIGYSIGRKKEDKTKSLESYLFGVIFSMIGAIIGYYSVQQFDFILALFSTFIGIILGWKLGYGIGKKKINPPSVR